MTGASKKQSTILFEATNIDHHFQEKNVLSGVNIAVNADEIVTLIGPNGAGKSTIVRIMLGLLKPDSGTVKRKPSLRIGYMPQRLEINAALPMTVNGFLFLGIDRNPGRVLGKRQNVLDEVGAGRLSQHQMTSLSGGEMQRVLLARALLRDPDVLVLDEPAGGVDVTGQADLYALITAIKDRRKIGVFMVSHDLHLVMASTDKVICLNHHVCCAGNPEQVKDDPAYIKLFGNQVADNIAIYHHHHDHKHDLELDKK